MREFDKEQWAKIRKELDRDPEHYGLPPRIDGSVVVASFNIRKLGSLREPGGDGGRDPETMKFLRDVCRHFDLLAIQEVMPDMTAVRKLRELMGKRYGLVASDTTGTFPGDPGNPERHVFIYNTDVVRRAELVTDLTYDRTEVLRRLFNRRKAINSALESYATELKRKQEGKRKSTPQIKMPEFLAFIRTPFAAEFKIGPYDFVAIDAHLHYGHYKSDRQLEGKAIAEWIVGKVRATESLNAVLFGDLNLDYDKPASDLKRIIGVAKELRDKGKPGEKQVRVSFPFLFPHPRPKQPVPDGSKIFRTNAKLTETFDQIAIFTQDERLSKRLETRQNGHLNKDAWGATPQGPDYGVFNFTELFSKALTGKSFHELDKDGQNELVKQFDFSVSDHLPIWLRMPLQPL